MWHGICQRGPGDPGADVPPRYGRFRQLGGEFGKFAVIGGTGVIITNAVYDLLFLHLGAGPVTSTTIATAVAAIGDLPGQPLLVVPDQAAPRCRARDRGIRRAERYRPADPGRRRRIQLLPAAPRARQAGRPGRAERGHRAGHAVQVLVLPAVRLGDVARDS
jgi:hypothetical protein